MMPSHQNIKCKSAIRTFGKCESHLSHFRTTQPTHASWMGCAAMMCENRTFAPPNLHMRDRHYPTYTCELDGMPCHDVTLMCENRTLALSHYPTQDAIGFCFD